jgi:hypothetical protein|tara:strand:+ start:221 stop:1225 length:1005 start_codon:yes stop_codon:yes gene_type:complete
MKILYIPVSKKINEKNFKNYFKCFLYDVNIIIKNFLPNRKVTKNTHGYIDSAIHSNAFVFELPYNYCLIFSKVLNLIFDALFVNWKFTNDRNDRNINLKLIEISKKFKIKKVIVDSSDLSNHNINVEVLEKFDNVIKREKNKSISNNKYLTTMLPLTLIDYKVSKKQEIINWSKIGKSKPNDKFKFDIYFSGTPNNKYRYEILEFLKKKNLNFYGQLSKLPLNEYLNTIYSSSINLALVGTGGAEFTFRHLEILSCCSFLMCHNEINQLELPLPIKDGEHFVTFENKEDLLEKINFYLNNKDLRSKIALKGRQALENYYSPKNHGEEVFKKIFS